MLHHHHTAEDEDVFPRIAARDVDFAREREAVADDHGALASAFEAVAAGLAEVASGGHGDPLA
jgi:hypothetical protein